VSALVQPAPTARSRIASRFGSGRTIKGAHLLLAAGDQAARHRPPPA